MTAPETVVVQTGSNAGRIWFPQAIRAVACLIVMFEHLGSLYPNNPQDAARWGHFTTPTETVIHTPWRFMTGWTDSPNFMLGHMAVACFFLVSGFVIPFSLRRSSVAEFTAKRVFRLYPTLAACALITVFVTWLQAVHEGVAQPYSVKSVLMSVTLSATFQHRAFVDPVYWTLVVEELFYVSAAVIVWRKLYGSRAWLLAFATGFTVLAVIPSHDNSGLFWLSFYVAFVPFVYIGTAIHHVYVGEWKLRQGLLVGAALYGLFTIGMYFSGNRHQATRYTHSAAAAIVLFIALAYFGPRVPYSRVLDELSKITYPLYLLHGVNGFIALHWLETKNVSFLLAFPIACAFGIVSATVVHLVVEEPAVKVGRRIANSVQAQRARTQASASVDVST